MFGRALGSVFTADEDEDKDEIFCTDQDQMAIYLTLFNDCDFLQHNDLSLNLSSFI